MRRAGRCWGVIDIDSFDLGASGPADARGLTDLLVRAGLTGQVPYPEPIVI